MIRIFNGAVLTDTAVSEWLFLVVVAVSLSIGLGKRRNEILGVMTAALRIVKDFETSEIKDLNKKIR